jgi:Toastrack DUF4097
MKSVLCTVQGAITAIATLGVIALANAGGAEEGTIKRSFHVGAGGHLVLATDRGAIEVRAADSTTLEIEVKEAHGIALEFTQSGNDVQIRGKDRRSSWHRRGPQFVISVPHQYNVDLHTSGGSIAVDDLEGRVRGRTAGGSLAFGRIHGPVWGKTSGGSIALAGCVGPAEVETSGGSIHIGDVDGDVIARTSGGSIRIARATGRVVAETSGGSIDVAEVWGTIDAATSGGSVTARLARQPQGSSRLETSGGNVVVFLAETISVELDAKASDGRVTTELPVTVQREFSKTALQAKINEGGPKLMLRTSGGDIQVNPLRMEERDNASEAIWLGREGQEEPLGEAEMKEFDYMGALALVLIFGPILAAVVGGIFIKALKILKGIPPQQSKQLRAEETKLMQEIYQGLSRMQERVEVLETILLDRHRKAGDK